MKFLLKQKLRQVAADEDQAAFALFGGLPRKLVSAFDEHTHALNDKALIVPFHGDDTLHPQEVGTETLHDKLDPWNESVRAHWLLGSQRYARDLIIMFVLMRFIQKPRLEFKDAIQIEGVLAEHLVKRNAATLGIMQCGVRIVVGAVIRVF